MIITLILGSLAVYSFIGANRHYCEVRAAYTAEPTRMSVDLSAPGTIEGRLVQTYSGSHCQDFLLELEGLPEDVRSPFAGLQGKLEVLDVQGESTAAADLVELLSDSAYPRGARFLASVRPFRTGEYTLRVRVDQPAEALAGVRQTLVCRYMLCGLEMLPVLVFNAIGFASGLPALIVGGFTTYGMCKYGWRKKAPTRA